MSTAHRAASVSELWPLLFVTNLTRSLTFYREQLGFELIAEDKPGDGLCWCRLKRGGASIMLQQMAEGDVPVEDRGRVVALYFICDDVDLLYHEFVSCGLNLSPPSIAYYGMKQLFVPEPDGHFICFEHPLKA